MPRPTPPETRFRGGALHPGERRCQRCQGRIGDTEQCLLVHEDPADRVSTFRHVHCPSPPFSGRSQLSHAWEEASATLRQARSWYQELGKTEAKKHCLPDLISTGKRLHEAIQKEERLVAASLVLGLREWARAMGISEEAKLQPRKKKPYVSSRVKTPSLNE
jgi:hypothetical protein